MGIPRRGRVVCIGCMLVVTEKENELDVKKRNAYKVIMAFDAEVCLNRVLLNFFRFAFFLH